MWQSTFLFKLDLSLAQLQSQLVFFFKGRVKKNFQILDIVQIYETPPLVWTPKVWTPGRWSDPPPPPQKFGHQKFESIYTFGLLRRQSPNCSGVWEIRGFNQCNHNDFYHWDGTWVAFLCKYTNFFHTNFFGQGSLTPLGQVSKLFSKKSLGPVANPPPFSDNVRNLEVFFWTLP